MILLIFQDNEAILEMDFIWKHSFSDSSSRKCYKGEFFFFPNYYLMIVHSRILGECIFFLEQKMNNSFVKFIP